MGEQKPTYKGAILDRLRAVAPVTPLLRYPPAMRFSLIDDVLEQDETRIVAVKNVSNAEEYLLDHFPTFPVLPGVMMLEVLVQAARALLGPDGRRHVLGKVSATKYASFVRPGETLRVEVELMKRAEDGQVQFKGVGLVVPPGTDPAEATTCVSSRFTMRPMRAGSAELSPETTGSVRAEG